MLSASGRNFDTRRQFLRTQIKRGSHNRRRWLPCFTHLASATQDGDATNKKYIDDNYLKLSGGTVTGHIILNNPLLVSQYQAISQNTGNAYFVQIFSPHVYSRFNLVKNKTINLGDPTDATDAVNLQTLNKHNIKPRDLHILWIPQEVFYNGLIC